MNSWKLILATIVIFGAGVFSGGLLVNIVEHPKPVVRHPPAVQPQPELQDSVARPEILRTNFVQRLDDALNLTPEQRTQIEKIIAQAQQRNRNLWQLVSPQMSLVNQDARQRIRATLTGEQRKQFENLLRQPRRLPAITNAPPELQPTNVVITNSLAI